MESEATPSLTALWDKASGLKGTDAVEAWESLYRAVYNESLFSSNEDVDDVSTEALRYLLVPSKIAFAYLEIMENRARQNRKFLEYSKRFLVDCDMLGLLQKNDRKMFERGEEPVDAGTLREEKISMFHRRKSLKDKIKELDAMLGKCKLDKMADTEEFVREKTLAEIDDAICNTLDQMRYSQMELQMIAMKEEREDARKRNPHAAEANDGKVPSKKPQAFRVNVDGSVQHIQLSSSIDDKIARRAQARREVFRDPNPPTMTIEQAIELEIQQGGIIMPDKSPQFMSEEAKEDVQSEEDDSDDDFKLREKRAWDNWKDDNERGIGNRGYL